MPFRVGAPELIVLLVILLLVFGVGKLPQVGQAVGKAVRQFRDSQEASLDSESANDDKVKAGSKGSSL
ncbi:MAG: twin-arginine translocase TatA/TatE family subunit [Chloroflexi bacterium]|nr:twin-arginine translocase TatA/TatE family subunit [Chloroflexota bacterium]